jgi:hypothetical protein
VATSPDCRCRHAIVGKRFLRKIVPDLQGGAYQRLHFGKWSRARSVVVAEIDLASIRPLNEIEENARAPVRDLGR